MALDVYLDDNSDVKGSPDVVTILYVYFLCYSNFEHTDIFY